MAQRENPSCGRQSETRLSPWHRSATRWTQVTFTDDDPGTFEVDFWIDVMRRTKSNALCLSAGGYMAFYPTRVPLHHRSAHLGADDPFGILVEEARRLGMHVMARVDPHAVHQEAADAHPEWLARDEQGRPIEHSSMPGVYWTDPFSTYFSEHITEIAQEITAEYDVDALFANRWESVRGVSYSVPVVRRFREETGHELPRLSDLDDPAWPVYSAWRSQQFSELVVRWDDAVRSVKPHVRFIPNRNPWVTRDLVREIIEDRYPMFVIDKQGRWGDEPSWTPGRIGKRTRGLFPDRPLALLSSVGTEDHTLRWKDSVTDPHELRSYIVDGFIHGARPWFSKFKAEIFDTRWVEPVIEAFDLHEKCEHILEGLEHRAEIALLDTARPEGATPWHRSEGDTEAHENGIYQALLEARIPFEYIADETLTLDRLDGVRVLILPSCPDLESEHISVLEAFVARGGSIVACFDSSLTRGSAPALGSIPAPGSGLTPGADLVADVRPETTFALGELLGVRLAGDVRGPVQNNYMTIEGDHPISEGYAGAQRIVGGTRVLEVEAAEPADVVFRFIPDYPDLPMEEVYPRSYDGSPAVIAREHASGGRTVYMAFNVGEVYWQALQSDHGRLIANAVRWASGQDAPLAEVSGLGLIDIAVQQGEGQIAVSLVNLNSPMAMRGQLHQTIPLADQEVRVRLPEGVTNAETRLVVAEQTKQVQAEDGVARVPVERLDLLETVHVTWPVDPASTGAWGCSTAGRNTESTAPR